MRELQSEGSKQDFRKWISNKNIPIIPDIRDIDGTEWRGATLLTGGFPCQPFSIAGQRRGKDDDRHLWPEMLRVIKEARPHWIVGENVAGIVPMALDQVLTDLEDQNYSTQTVIIPACAKNAPHRRDRVWIIGYSDKVGCHWDSRQEQEISDKNTDSNRSNKSTITDSKGREPRESPKQEGREDISRRDSQGRHAADSKNFRPRGIRNESEEEGTQDGDELFGVNDRSPRFNRHPDISDVQRSWEKPKGQNTLGLHSGENKEWEANWIEVARRFCVLDARFSNGLVGCLTMPETHGIMGYILSLRKYHYAENNESGARKILSILQEAASKKTVREFFGRLRTIYEPETLRCPLHGTSNDERESNAVGPPQKGSKIQEEDMPKMWDEKGIASSPSRREPGKQCSCEFDDIVWELSSEMALVEWSGYAEASENILFNMWKESRGIRFLHEPLSALQEIWRSITNKEIGSFRRHFDIRDRDRVKKLKSLGNAIVPQVAKEIIEKIAEIERGTWPENNNPE